MKYKVVGRIDMVRWEEEIETSGDVFFEDGFATFFDENGHLLVAININDIERVERIVNGKLERKSKRT